MNLGSTEYISNLMHQPSTYSIYKRIANLVLVIVAGLICVNLWLLNTDQASNWYAKQQTQLGRSLVSYGAKVIAPAMQTKDSLKITANLTQIAEDPHVISASVFGYHGQIIDSTQTNTSVVATFLLEETSPIVFVEEVKYEGKIVGYLRILLDEQKVMSYHNDYQMHLYEQLLVMMLLSGLAGLLVARAYYKFRYRNYIKTQNNQ